MNHVIQWVFRSFKIWANGEPERQYRAKLINHGNFYIGKKASDKFDPNYYGSGKQLKEELKLYGKENYEVTILEKASSREDLDKREKRLITQFKELCGNKCINRAQGGEGGNVHCYDTPEEHEAFVKKMTKINSERCRTDEFRELARARMIKNIQIQKSVNDIAKKFVKLGHRKN